MREPLTWQAARRWLIWPTAAALVVALGALLGVRLAEDGRPLAAAILVAVVRRSSARPSRTVLVSQLVTAQRLALRDPLTGLPNRALLDDRIEQALARSQRTAEAFALLVVDLDGFKGVNDVRGHEAGNTVLRVIAKRLQAVVRGVDTVARVGGDEFVVLSLGTASDEEAAALVGRLRNALRRPYRVDGGLVEIDASIGWALFPQDGLTPGELLARADGQMYATKRDTSERIRPAAAARRRRRARPRVGARAGRDRRPLPADRPDAHGRDPGRRGARPAACEATGSSARPSSSPISSARRSSAR